MRLSGKDPLLVGFHFEPDRLVADASGAVVGSTFGVVVELVSLRRRGAGESEGRFYEGRVLDPTDARPLDGEPQRLEGAGDARRWWVAAAGPSVPLPRALREVVRVRAGEASAEAEVREGVPA